MADGDAGPPVDCAAEVDVITHVPVPEQDAPLQPANALDPSGKAARVIDVFAAKDAVQTVRLPPQSMPGGVLSTWPTPVPAVETVMVNGPVLSKAAWTACGAVMWRTHVPVPEQSPDQPSNDELGAGDAVSVTTAVVGYAWPTAAPLAQFPSDAHVIVPLASVTVPAPLPRAETRRPEL